MVDRAGLPIVLALNTVAAWRRSKENMFYNIRKADPKPNLKGDWEDSVWGRADTLDIAHFHPKSSAHRPRARARLLFDHASLYLHFRVEDRYVRSVQVGYQKPVCTDSCVEFFVQPVSGKGYLNFEVNCGGALLLYFIGPNGRDEKMNMTFEPVDEAWLRKVEIYHSMPEIVDPEMTMEVEWYVAYAVPFALFEAHLGAVDRSPHASWRANFYKCGDATSHPHWGAWAEIGERLDFHQPHAFGVLKFVQ